MPEYLVTWQMDIEAHSPEEAARKAKAFQRKEDTTADVFEVLEKDGSGEPHRVDLTEIDMERLPILRGQLAALGKWTQADSVEALSQGWEIFDTGEFLEIQRVDDMSDHRASGVPEPVFDSDEDAVHEVRQMAAKGISLAIKAIAIHDLSIIDRR
jgi:phage terminase large subunit-like protein